MTFYPGTVRCEAGDSHDTGVVWTPVFRRPVLYCRTCGQVPRQGSPLANPSLLARLTVWFTIFTRHFALSERT
jgi:hypothetical protein